MRKALRPHTLLFLVFFSLSGSVESEPISMEHSPIYEMRTKEDQGIVIVSQTFFSAEEQQELLLEDGNPVETVLDLQNQVLERHIQQADDMGNELDKIIQMLEE